MNTNHLFVRSIIALGIAGLILGYGGSVLANEDDLPLDDQVRFIGELESRSADEWNFSTDGSTFEDDTYLLQMSKPDIRLIEQNISRWGNDGYGRNYSILVEVYDSNEE